MPKLKVTASHEALEVLGGLLLPGVDRVPFPDPVFDQFPRPPSTELPPLRSKDRLFLVGDGFEEAYMKVFNGEGFWIWWEASSDPQWEYTIRISAFDAKNPPPGLQQLSGPLVSADVMGGINKSTGYNISTHACERCGLGLRCEQFASLPYRKGAALFRRAVHLLIRTMGNSIDGDVSDVFGTLLLDQYCSEERWKEAIDICVALTDISQQQKPVDKNRLCWWMLRLGEMMEAKGRFKMAGDTYRCCIQLESDANRPIILHACGLANFRAENYDAAEEHLVHALHILNTRGESSSDANEEEILLYLSELFYLYVRWTDHKVTTGRESNDGSILPEMAAVQATLASMLVAVGFKGTHRTPDCMIERIEMIGGYFYKHLENKMKSRVKAKKAVKALFSINNARHFRSSLMSHCKNARTIRSDAFFRWLVVTESKGHGSEDDQAFILDMARRSASEVGEISLIHDVFCASPDCSHEGDEAQFKKCPCRNVFYCSKECQETHWPDHKLVCPVSVAKKQKGRGSRSSK